MSSSPRKSLYHRWRDLVWDGPSLRWLAAFSLVVLLSAAALATAAVLGFRDGMAQRQALIQAEVETRLSNAQAHRAAGRTELAVIELQRLLQLDPQNATARQWLADLQAPTPTPSPTPLMAERPLLVPPEGSAPATPTVAPQAVLLAQAQQAASRGELSLAAALLEELAALDPTFQPETVQALRFDVAYQRGLRLLAEGSAEQAARAFEEALQVRPDDPDARLQRDLALLYAEALGAWRIDWDRAVRSLQAIYDRRPDYLDVADRLIMAQVYWGDALARESQWCQAVQHYAIALKSSNEPTLQERYRQASEYCQNPPTPTPPLSAGEALTATVSVGAAGPGALFFATYAPEFSRWSVYRWPLATAAPLRVEIEGASQPALSPLGHEIALRSERGDQVGLGVLRRGEGSWLRITQFAEDAHPHWSPDGQQIVFESAREGDRRWRIYRMWSGGGDQVSLGLGRRPAWSPNGQTIAYQGCDDAGNRCGLWLMAPDGTNKRPLTTVPGDTMPAWSPDGRWIAFASAERSGNWDLYLVNVATGAVSTLVASPGIDAHPAWSPDGRQVAFLSNQGGGWAIWLAAAPSGAARKALDLPGALPDWFEAGLSWGR